ncbi:bifunctional folylpolyglutamate synthase/dihydrofolate synthase [Methylovirgula sp. 4M-Z18]|nr:bifunctional folylpolyglutamate synthase/dihydrofolate synthase [Methylovirgula sp. 4M-Z18]
MRVSLAPMRDLMARLGNPHRTFRAVHVTGTKGKGSVCALVAAGLRRAGFHVGRYGSPHLEHVTERVHVNGAPVADETLAHALAHALDAYKAARASGTDGGNASWFDLLTAGAFLIFRDAGIAWAAIEVGLGGRYDSTNVVEGEVAVVTNVELEHTEVLGKTREAIAYEKIGILKPGAVLVTPLGLEDAAGRILAEQADLLHARIERVALAADASIAERNLAVAARVLDVIGASTPGVGAALLDPPTQAMARLPGRMEHVTHDGLQLVLDGAHVPFNIAQVLRDLAQDTALHGPCIAVLALGADKDAAGFLRELSGKVAHLIVTEAEKKVRMYPASDLAALAQSAGLDTEIAPTLEAAMERAYAGAGARGGWVLVTGSLYLVGAVRTLAARASQSQAGGSLSAPDHAPTPAPRSR